MSSLDSERSFVSVSEGTESLQSWKERQFIGEELRAQLEEANVLLVPNVGYFTQPGTLNFPEGTEEFFSYLKANEGNSLHPDVCIEDDDFNTLIQHADCLTLACIVTTSVIGPIVINLISDYIFQYLNRKFERAEVISKVTICDESTGLSVDLDYRGPAKEYREVMTDAVKQISKRGN